MSGIRRWNYTRIEGSWPAAIASGESLAAITFPLIPRLFRHSWACFLGLGRELPRYFQPTSQLDCGPRLDRTGFSLTRDSVLCREREYEGSIRPHGQPDEISVEIL